MRSVYIVDGSRTPCLKATKPGPFSAADLAYQAGRPLLARQPFTPDTIDEVVMGCVMPSPDEANIARIIGLRLGCGIQTPAWTVQRNCASGLQAIDSAYKDIAMGRHNLVLAGGVEAMSRAPLLYNAQMVEWFSAQMRAKSLLQKIKNIGKLRPHHFAPVIALLRGLRDPVVGLSMGQTAEELAYLFEIDRQAMDQFALDSHEKLARAQDKGFIPEIETLYANDGEIFEKDDGIRRDTTLDKLATLKPIFDKKYGNVTAGNSSQVTDGAAMLLLASIDAVEKYDLPVLGKIVDIHWAAIAPEVMGLGPVNASVPLVQKHGLTADDISYWEINEAFAAQVLACLKAFDSKDYCQKHFDMTESFGNIRQEQLNIDGGAIAVGHPIGMTGARVSLHMANILKRENKRYGVATMCIGGGQGGAILLENEEGE